MSIENPIQKPERNREQVVEDALSNLSSLTSWIDVLKNSPNEPGNQEMVDSVIKKIENDLRELKK